MKSQTQKQSYKAEFLWPNQPGSIEEAGFEFANARTVAHQRVCWRVLLHRVRSDQPEDHVPKTKKTP